MATASSVSTTVQEIINDAEEVLAAIEAVDPAIDVPVAIGESLANLVTKALAAWSAASGVPVTVASVQALLPDPTPLTPPTS